jgi:hypothetical protein
MTPTPKQLSFFFPTRSVVSEVLRALPGPLDSIAKTLGVSDSRVAGCIGALAARGLALRAHGVGLSAVWVRT